VTGNNFILDKALPSCIYCPPNLRVVLCRD